MCSLSEWEQSFTTGRIARTYGADFTAPLEPWVNVDAWCSGWRHQDRVIGCARRVNQLGNCVFGSLGFLQDGWYGEA